jgi:hypothetical protein
MIEKLGITPGPWEWNGFAGIHGSDVECTRCANVYVEGEIELSQEEADANARLISAAPEMLEALIENMMDWERTVGDENKLEDMRRTLDAIEKATGRTWQEVKEVISEAGKPPEEEK